MTTTSDDIIISGISGRFPECENVEEFWKALFEGKNLVTIDDRRFPPGLQGTPKPFGKIPHPEHFDGTFFGFPPISIETMDPRHRVFLEVVYECILDAGYNPKELRGSRTGVYVGIANCAEDDNIRKMDTEGYYLSGMYLGMCANRTSFVFDFKGPSYICDTACSSSFYAFSQAVSDLKNGIIDYAIVGGTHLIFCNRLTQGFKRLQLLSPKGNSKPFSEERNGYVRAETVAAVLLQKMNGSRRIYASVIGAGTNCDGYKKEGINYPAYDVQLQLIRDIFSSNHINPTEVTYFEAHATATVVGDAVECRAISKFLGEERKNSLLLGSVKSNMGHSEISSGLCSLMKVLAVIRTGVIPATISTEPLDSTLEGVKDGSLTIVTKNTPFEPGLIPISSMGFGGANAHVVIKPHPIHSNDNLERPEHRLVVASGRTAEAVKFFLDEVQNYQNDQEFLALVDEIHKFNIGGHYYRGFVVLGEHPIREEKKITPSRPIWFIYTGIGCQWMSMGKDIMKIETFKKTFDRCAIALKPYNVDLHHILTANDKRIFEDITNCFIGICAIQIALTDVLHQIGIYPDAIAGHSMGEVACAYADGCLTLEQAILTAYARGYALKQAKFELIRGAMAVVGLSAEEVTPMIPDGIFIGCLNSSSSVTISGPEEPTRAFIKKLQSQGIFAKLVETGNVAFHSKYVHGAGKYLLKFLKDVINEPQLRSSKWISTSVATEQESEEWARYNCAEYHYNNFCRPVLFQKIFEQIPENAIVIEIAPHGLLQAILKRELPQTVTNSSLLTRNCEDGEQVFLTNIGRLYLAGCQPQLRKFYSEVQFPVSNKAATISPLVKWDHSFSWFVPKMRTKESFGDMIFVDIGKPEWAYLQGHEIDGRILVPGTTYLLLVWQVFAEMMLKHLEEVPVVLEKLIFKRVTILVPKEQTKFYVNILTKTGDFEIFEGSSIIASGKIKILENYESEFEYREDDSEYDMIKKNDFYKQFKLKKYNYKDCFRGIEKYDMKYHKASIKWYGKFDCFLDSMMQMQVINYMGTKDLFLPTYIEKLVIDPISFLKTAPKQTEVPVNYNKILNIVECNGIELHGTVLSKTSTRERNLQNPLLELQQFVHYKDSSIIKGSFVKSLITAMEIVLQNYNGVLRRLNVCEIVSENTHPGLSEAVSEILSKKPFIIIEQMVKKDVLSIDGKYDVLLFTNPMKKNLPAFGDLLNENGFLIYQSSTSLQHDKFDLDEIFSSVIDSNKLYLFRKPAEISPNFAVVNVDNKNLNWMDEIKDNINKDSCKVIYLSSKDNGISGVMGLANCLNKEPLTCKFKTVISDVKLCVEEDFFQKQLKKNLVLNIHRNNRWGTYVNLPVEIDEKREVNNATVELASVGNLASLQWVQSPSKYFGPHEHEETVNIFYSALNFRDIMLASGKITRRFEYEEPTAPSTYIGLEFSGVVGNKRVMGITQYSGISLQRQSLNGLMWDVPDQWSLEDAATVPLVYGTCYYALISIGQLRRNESILIHSGAGATGMAAISIALSLNCEVFTTIGFPEKKDYLMKMFPKLKEENIGNSRNKSFEKMIKIKTNGVGVDVVLNSLAGELFEASVRCLATAGRFLEIGKTVMYNRTSLDSYMFLKGCGFHGILFDNIYRHGLQHIIQNLIKEGINSGVVKPLPRTVFSETQIEDAFRFLADGKHTGKVLIQLRKEEPQVIRSPSRTIVAIARIFFDAHKTYVITGGLGGVGLELADWMIRKGAKNIILNSRSGLKTGYQKLCLAKFKQFRDTCIIISTLDSSKKQEAEDLVSQAEEIAPVGGVFNLAIVLRDKLFVNQTKADFDEVFKPKWNSVENLDRATRRMCKYLDHFVVFSSITSGLGNPGQTNYGMANSALERLCENRKSEGLPALAVEYGPIGEVGQFENMDHDGLWKHFVEPQLISSCFNVLEKFMLQSHPVCMSLVPVDNQVKNEDNKERTPAETIAHILGIKDLSAIDLSLTMVQLGMDSLMSAEIIQTLQRTYDITLDIKNIQDITFGRLLEMGNKGVKLPIKQLDIRQKLPNLTFVVPNDIVITLKSQEGQRKIFVFHSLEGHVDQMVDLAQRLNAEVCGLQCTSELKFERVRDFAEYYEKIIRKIQPQGPYILLGHSFGSYLCMETALILESSHEIVQIICLDGSPAYCRYVHSDFLIDSEKTWERTIREILMTFSLGFPNVDKGQVENKLRQSTSVEQQTKDICQFLHKITDIEVSKLEVSIELLIARLKAESSYKPDYILQSTILLVRAENSLCQLTEQYDLEKLCSKVNVFKLPGDHISLQRSEHIDEIARIINELML